MLAQLLDLLAAAESGPGLPRGLGRVQGRGGRLVLAAGGGLAMLVAMLLLLALLSLLGRLH